MNGQLQHTAVSEFEKILESVVVDPKRLLLDTLQIEETIFEPKIEIRREKAHNSQSMHEICKMDASDLLQNIQLNLHATIEQSRTDLRQTASKVLTQRRQIVKRSKKGTFVNRGIFLKFFNIWEFLRMSQF